MTFLQALRKSLAIPLCAYILQRQKCKAASTGSCSIVGIDSFIPSRRDKAVDARVL